MEKVLARRDENWKKLQQYVLDEREQMEVRGLGDVPIWGEVRDYTWYLQDGFFVRSPVKVNGVLIAESERRKYEEDYLRRAKERDKRRGRGGPPAAAPPEAPTPAASDPADVQDFILQTRQPQFVDSAYFLKFKFEPSKYALVGHETFEGRDVLRIEYYPSRLFVHEQDQQERRRQQNQSNRSRDESAAIERMMNKVSLVTIWVEPKSSQIVKYTFDNVNLEFLPAAWLRAHGRREGRDDDERALPRRVAAPRREHAGLRHARGRVVRYSIPPRLSALSQGRDQLEDQEDRRRPAVMVLALPLWLAAGMATGQALEIQHSALEALCGRVQPPAPGARCLVPDTDALQGEAAEEVLAEIRVHGNLIVSNDEVIKIAGVTPGEPFGSRTIDDVTARLRASKKFQEVQVLKRFASISDPTQIALVIVVNEGPVRIESGAPGTPLSVVRRRGIRKSDVPSHHRSRGRLRRDVRRPPRASGHCRAEEPIVISIDVGRNEARRDRAGTTVCERAVQPRGTRRRGAAANEPGISSRMTTVSACGSGRSAPPDRCAQAGRPDGSACLLPERTIAFDLWAATSRSTRDSIRCCRETQCMPQPRGNI